MNELVVGPRQKAVKMMYILSSFTVRVACNWIAPKKYLGCLKNIFSMHQSRFILISLRPFIQTKVRQVIMPF